MLVGGGHQNEISDHKEISSIDKSMLGCGYITKPYTRLETPKTLQYGFWPKWRKPAYKQVTHSTLDLNNIER